MVSSAGSQPGFDSGRRYRHNPRLARQTLGGKAVVLHYEGKRLYGLNETGSRVWGLLDGRLSVDEISALLADDSGVERTTVALDVASFVRELLERGLIVEAQTGEARASEGEP